MKNRWMIRNTNEAMLMPAETDMHSLMFQASFGFGWTAGFHEGTTAGDMALCNFRPVHGTDKLFHAENEQGTFLVFREDHEDSLKNAHVCGRVHV